MKRRAGLSLYSFGRMLSNCFRLRKDSRAWGVERVAWRVGRRALICKKLNFCFFLQKVKLLFQSGETVKLINSYESK